MKAYIALALMASMVTPNEAPSISMEGPWQAFNVHIGDSSLPASSIAFVDDENELVPYDDDGAGRVIGVITGDVDPWMGSTGVVMGLAWVGNDPKAPVEYQDLFKPIPICAMSPTTIGKDCSRRLYIPSTAFEIQDDGQGGERVLVYIGPPHAFVPFPRR